MADELNPPIVPPAEPLAPVSPVIEPPAPSVSADLLERAGKVGLDFGDVGNDRDFALKLFEAYESDRPFAQHGRQALVNPPAQPVAAKEPEQAAEEAFDLDKHFSEAWKLPELSPGAQWALQRGAFTTDDKGMIVPAPGAESAALPYIREVQEHSKARDELTEEFQRNPVRFMYDKLIPALRHELRSDFESLDKETRTRTEAEAFEKKFADENKDWLFTPQGQLSPAALKFQEAVKQWRAKGVNDPEALAKLASAEAKPSATQAQPEATPAEPSGEGRPRGPDGKFLSKQESFLESAKRQSAASGSRSAPDAEDFKPANRGELDNIWMQAFQRQKAGAA